MPTKIKFGSALAVKRWTGVLFLDTQKKSYFEKKFIGETDNAVIQRLTDLETGPGDTQTYDLSIQLRGKPTSGDARLDGKEEALKFASDEIYIDQLRKAVSAGGKMTRKRTMHDLRSIARDRLSDYWAAYTDQLLFTYLSGSRGINEDYIEDVAWGGHANNPINPPDAGHLIYGGTATSKASVTTADVMSRNVIERAAVAARMMSALDKDKVNMLPTMINGEGHFVMIMSPFQEHSLRTDNASGWIDIQKAAAAAEGRNNPIFKGGLGMVNNVVLHSHANAIRFKDYGTGANLPAARALFLGRQAGILAYGSSGGGLRLSWKEELKDFGNEPTVAAGMIIGVKKARFRDADFGVTSVDTYAPNPNP